MPRRVTLLLLASLLLVPADASAVTVVLVRHAEKDAGDDPPLSPAGRERAGRLAALLADAGVTGIYVTDTRRTVETAAPLAATRQLTPAVRSRKDPAAYVRDLAAELRSRPDQDVVVVVSHSDTVPLLIAALGLPGNIVLSEKDYDDVFVARVPPTGAPALLRLGYPPR